MGHTFIWEIKEEQDKYADICKIAVSSEHLQANQHICSLLENGWEVIKVKIKHYNHDIRYQYSLGKPL